MPPRDLAVWRAKRELAAQVQMQVQVQPPSDAPAPTMA
jgi:hypothetical protein